MTIPSLVNVAANSSSSSRSTIIMIMEQFMYNVVCWMINCKNGTKNLQDLCKQLYVNADMTY